MRKSILLVILSLVFTNIFAQRDPLLWPFTAESIWNMPLHDSAWAEGNHADANIDVVGPPTRFKAEGVHLFFEDTLDPVVDYHRVKWSNRCTDHYHYKNNSLHFPNKFTWNGEENKEKNSAFVFVRSDNETIWDATLLTRCNEGGWLGGAWFAPDRPYSIVGSGAGRMLTSENQQEDIWGHGASKMSALGGLIREGELTSPENEPISHALKFTIYARRYLASCKLYGKKSFRWPAQGADGYACDENSGYNGNDTEFVMGSLLAIPPEITKEDLSLKTRAARKIFDALQTYGGYVVEDAAWDRWHFFAEQHAVESDWPTGSTGTITTGSFFEELQKIVNELHIIKLNTPDNIGGGPTSDHINRRAPLACEPGSAGSGKICPKNGSSYTPDNPFDTLKVFPNPATNRLTITSGQQKIDTVSIYNLTGQLIMKTQVNNTIASIDSQKLRYHDMVLLQIKMGEQIHSRKILIL